MQLKEIALLTGTELKTKAMDLLVMSHGLRHENINPFIGEWNRVMPPFLTQIQCEFQIKSSASLFQPNPGREIELQTYFRFKKSIWQQMTGLRVSQSWFKVERRKVGALVEWVGFVKGL